MFSFSAPRVLRSEAMMDTQRHPSWLPPSLLVFLILFALEYTYHRLLQPSTSIQLAPVDRYNTSDDYEFSGLAAEHKGAVILNRPCPLGCEEHGNCNKELGRCECPVGYTGPSCDEPVWPSCKLHPKATEMFCEPSYPKSCDCLKECAKWVCPSGPKSCERYYDITTSKCFERPANYSEVVDGVNWDGGSSIPEERDNDVRYYRGAIHDKYTIAGGTVTRSEALDMQPGNEAGLMALPLGKCPDSCSFQGGCVQRKNQRRPHCRCHYGWAGYNCREPDVQGGLQNICWNNCQGQGVCRRGFCHCKQGWWGKDCGRSKAFAAHSALRLVHKLKVYAYELPWEVAYQPEYRLGWRDHDQIYMAWQVFGEMLYNDTLVRTENPWEANMYYIPALTFAYSSNLGNTIVHARRVVDYVRHTWPFFNRTKGLDHFMWLTNDRGACFWPGEEELELANILKVVHFGWHNHPGAPLPEGWKHPILNKHWGCFHPLRDIVAAPYAGRAAQSDLAALTYGLSDNPPLFDPNFIPKRLLFFAGGIRHWEPEYSHGVRQQLHKLFGYGTHPNVTIHEGTHPEYTDMIRGSKFCLAPSGHGWGIRLSQYMVAGCVPVIVQDDIYQPWEDLLPYSRFSIRLPKSRLPAIAEVLGAVSNEEYLALRAGVAKYWPAFVWDRSIGGVAYDYMVDSLRARMERLNARHFYPLRLMPPRHAPGNITACRDQESDVDGTGVSDAQGVIAAEASAAQLSTHAAQKIRQQQQQPDGPAVKGQHADHWQ